MRRRDFLTRLPGLVTMPLMLPQAAKAAKATMAKAAAVAAAATAAVVLGVAVTGAV